MNLKQLRELLCDSSPSEWSKLDSDGPLYQYGLGTWTGPDDHGVSVKYHYSSAVYRQDVDLTLQWGMAIDDERDSRDQRHFDWAEKFINKRIRPFWVDVFWRGTLVDRYAMISVDGGHGLVPFPHTAGEEPDWYDVVTEREVALCELIASLEGYRDTSYIARAGFKIVADED